MSKRRLAVLSLCASLAVFCVPAWSVSYQPVSPDELKMTGDPKAPGAPAIILFRQVDRDDRGHTAHEDVYFRIKILTEEGRKYGDIEIPFYKEMGSVVNIHARTIEPDGTIVELTGKAFDKSIAKARGFKYLAKTFTLPMFVWARFLSITTPQIFPSSSISIRTGSLATSCIPGARSSHSGPIPVTTYPSTCAGHGIGCPRKQLPRPKVRTTSSPLTQRTSRRFRPKTTCPPRMR